MTHDAARFRFPASAAEGAAQRDFGVYIHVPFCVRRCGYCDFNTYTNRELGGGADLADYAVTAVREIEWADGLLRELEADALAAGGATGTAGEEFSGGARGGGVVLRPVSTVFFGGGTPTLLPTTHLIALLDAVRRTWGLKPGAEVTTEANPESVSAEDIAALAEAGFTRISFGMQSAVPHVLHTLDRTHRPERVAQVVGWAKAAGLQVSLDLIYGTPGETADDWQRTLDAAIELAPHHVSAYALVVEPGTKMGAQVRRGELPMPDDDVAAARYEAADAALSAASYRWYEVSNWARAAGEAGGGASASYPETQPSHACRHNLAYWRGQDWWGVGPGAHGHIGGVRWWNLKHPRAYAQALASGRGPVQGYEVLDAQTRELERIMLGVRLAEGLAATPAQLGDARLRATLRGLVQRGLVEREPLGVLVEPGPVVGAAGPEHIGASGTVRPQTGEQLTPRVVLTLRGRLLADAVVRELI